MHAFFLLRGATSTRLKQAAHLGAVTELLTKNDKSTHQLQLV